MFVRCWETTEVVVAAVVLVEARRTDADDVVLVVFAERGLVVGLTALLGLPCISIAVAVAAVVLRLDVVEVMVVDLIERVLNVFASVATDAPPNTDDASWS